jgi:adenylosuccinate synthase
LGEAGLGPKSVRDVYVVFKPYITRVGPGPLEKEIFDEKELEIYHTKGHEIGSVSKRLRRVGEFEWKSAARAIMINNCTKIAITHIDMFEGNDRVKNAADFTADAKKFLADLQALSDRTYPHPKIALISTGPDMEDTLVL